MGALSEALFGAGEAFTTLRPSTQIRRIERVPSAESTTTKGGGEGASWQWRLSAAPPKTKRGDTTVSLVNSVEDDCQTRPHCLTDFTDLTDLLTDAQSRTLPRPLRSCPSAITTGWW